MLESARTDISRRGLRGGGIIRQEFRINEEIRAREVRVISPEGQQLGVMPFREALRLAQERDMDLVEVAPYESPPVCRIMNYGKYKYEQSKKDREARKRQKIVQVKEIRMTPKIEEHDFDVKARSIERFLRDGDKVKVTVRFRGREIVHADLAKNMLQGLVDRLQGLAVVERAPRVEGRAMIMMLAPRPDVQARARAAVSAAAAAAPASPAGSARPQAVPVAEAGERAAAER